MSFDTPANSLFWWVRFFILLLHRQTKSTMKNQLQLIVAAGLAFAGIALLYVGTLLAPQGEIHESILVAFGEVATFAGSIIGIDYKYRNTKNDEK